MKIVLITGVSRGIGKALAERFLGNGDFVLGTSTKGTAEYAHDNLKTFSLDLAGSESIQDCVAEITKLGKSVDILINNAGIAVEEEVDEPRVNIDFLRKTLEVNLIGTIDFTEGIIPLMTDGGHIVNVTSRAGSFGYMDYHSNYPAYRISKAGLNMFTKLLDDRLAGRITVSSVHPGFVKTDMGGDEGEIEPEQAAEEIFKLTQTNIESGQFWFEGKKFPW